MNELLLLATEAPAGGDDTFIKGIAITVAFIVVFVGSVWLLTSMILGAKLGYFVTGSCLFAVMVLISLIWVVTALGPKGEQGFWGDLGNETAWHAIAAGPDLSTVSAQWGSWDVGSYPSGEGWVEPAEDVYLADLGGQDSTASELANARPIMDSLIGQAVNSVPGIREGVADQVQGGVNVTAGEFAIVDVRMQQAEVEGKDSVIAVGRVVPTGELVAGDLGGAEEATIVEYMAEPGDTISEGDPVVEVETPEGTTELTASTSGRIISVPFVEGDAVNPDGALATVDISGQEGAPEPAEVAAVRVRGSVRVPSLIYLGVSLVLLVVHLIGLSRTEKAAKLTQPQIA